MSLSGIRMAAQALQAHQRSLEVTGQNIANVNTPGYSRQVTVTRSVPGGGVDVAGVMRTHAAWLDSTAGALAGESGRTAVHQQYASRLEETLREPGDAGLQTALDRFFSAATDLADNAGDISRRQSFLRSGQQLAARFQELSTDLGKLSAEAQDQFKQEVDSVNGLLKQIASLNESISASRAAGNQPNELLDQRQALLTRLTEKTGATSAESEDGELIVSIGGRAVVQGTTHQTLAVSGSEPFQVMVAGSGDSVRLPSGTLRALQEWGADIVPAQQQAINALRDDLAAQVNQLHAAGTGLDGSTGTAFFTVDAQGNLAVNPDLLSDPRKLAAGDGTAGGGSVMREVAGMGRSDAALPVRYRDFVTQVAERSAQSASQAEQAELSRLQIESMQASESGVNLDEELARMVELQHAYSASARLLTTFDQMLDSLINMGR